MSIYNSINRRENVEWGNYWWSDAPNLTNKKRYLLIGDSTSRAYRSTLEQKMDANVDFFGTSARITDTLFWQQLECFLSVGDYKYDGIQIQLGYHGINIPEDLNSEEIGRWGGAYTKLIERLLTISKNIVIATATHVVKMPNKCNGIRNWFVHRLMIVLRGSKGEILDDEINQVIQVRNKVAEDLACKYNLKFLDLYKIMIESKFKHIDLVHFEDSHKSFIAAVITEKIKGTRLPK